MAHGRDQQIAWCDRDLKVGKNARGVRSDLGMRPDCPFRFARGAARVVEDSYLIARGEIMCGGTTDCFSRPEQIEPVLCWPKRINGREPGCTSRQLATPFQERRRVDDECCTLSVLELVDLIRKRTQRVQKSCAQARRACRDPGTPCVRAIGGQQGDALPAPQAVFEKHRLHPRDQIDCAPVRKRAIAKYEGGTVGIAAERAQRLCGYRRTAVHPISHLVLPEISWRRVCVMSSIEGDSTTRNHRRGRNSFQIAATAPQAAAHSRADVPRLWRGTRCGCVPRRRRRRLPNGELPQRG